MALGVIRSALKGVGMKKFIAFVLIAAALLTVNAQTDFFSDFGSHAPAIEERFPDVVRGIEKGSAYISDITDLIPSPSELVALIKNEKLPIDPSDVAVNAYIENSPMMSFYPDENLSIKMKDSSYVRIFGISASKEKSHLIVRFASDSDDKLDQISVSTDAEGEFDKTIKIPECSDDKIRVDVYAGPKAYGDFTSWIYNYLYLEKTADGGWQVWRSPVYDSNKALYSEDRSISDALKSTASIQSSSDEIISLANEITRDCADDYEKLRAIHDWVCENIWYDMDSINLDQTVPYASEEVLENKSAVCLGFSTLTAALCRAVNIPCNVVSGYALGVGEDTEWTQQTINSDEQNHAWNEAYVKGRWVILDTTWDCPNRIENGERSSGKSSYLYFDANLDFFSNNHKITEYMRKP